MKPDINWHAVRKMEQAERNFRFHLGFTRPTQSGGFAWNGNRKRNWRRMRKWARVMRRWMHNILYHKP